MTPTATPPGLDGVNVADTVLSEVDGLAGRLVVRGMAIEDLTGQTTFEALAARLWDGLAPSPEDGAGVKAALGAARVAAYDHLLPLVPVAANLAPIAALRLGLAALPPLPGIAVHHALTGAMATFLAAVLRARAGLAPIAPDATASHAADFLRMLRGAPPSAAHAAALDAYFVTVAEHGLNASTFTARVIASTRAGANPAIIGALGALEGPLHGGAPGPVLDMLDAIGTADHAESWLAAQLAAGERLMGFGHRIYRVRDPRADVLAREVDRLAASGDARIDFAKKVERSALEALAHHKPDRPLHTNVEFFIALLLEAVGLPRDAFTAVFGLSRVVGWTAHVYEQQRDGRLLRPASRYVGPAATLAS